jgi:glycosyltransferase involved in cell wall biosynthesis
MGDWFSAADLLIHPAHSEGMGSVILEASLAGLPVIGSNTGGIPDAIAEEKNGLLIPANDPIALAEAIIRMKDDLTLQSSIKLNRATFIEKFDIKHAAKQYQEIYDHCAT